MPKEPISNIRLIHGDHYPEMIEKTLNELKKRKIKIKEGDYVKSSFLDGTQREWMWVKIIGLSEDELVGKLDNNPISVKNFEYSQVVKVDPRTICGYISKDGKVTVNPLQEAIEKRK